MKLYYKAFVLSFSLLLPVIIYLFLRFFGENRYELPRIDANCNNILDQEILMDHLNNREIKIIDVRSGNKDSFIVNNLRRIYRGNKIDIITLSTNNRNLEWLSYKLENQDLNDLYECYMKSINFEPFIILFDRYNILRGVYTSLSDGEFDRLKVEIDILKLENE